ncbi:L-amino acid N-acyltransferase YncA [Salinibacillus kushneri]|uniref:L-amino acid N-acyltransferase YncA n=1 Tax=Salinibacillus kushneri TaxID=237682 RepID=A0A1I0BFN2_9BACI|nr:GNAT family N-acetyltransferase [Salinibacillus kushneri]SET05608.1 L-amino acid N-acyltransferase YncA [Salinibacillus kushneri]
MIREARHSDIPTIMNLIQASVAIMQEERNEQWGKDYPLAKHYENDIEAGQLYVYEDQTGVQGVACISHQGHHEYDEVAWSFDSPYLCIKRLAVNPLERKKGIGLTFYQKAEEMALAKGIHTIRTDTYSKNQGAVKLFEKAGYHFVEERINDGREAPFYYYEKRF